MSDSSSADIKTYWPSGKPVVGGVCIECKKITDALYTKGDTMVCHDCWWAPLNEINEKNDD